MPKRMSREEFVETATNIHNNKYDYSLVEYVNNRTKVKIVCPIHGVFYKTPVTHIHQKQGCPTCGLNRLKKKICGVGINDFDASIKINGVHIASYDCWRNMIVRCYDSKEQQRHPSYIGCRVCEDWLYFSNFKEWFDKNYRKGYELDKDILSKDCKYYSPQTCLFVPKYINSLFRTRNDGQYGMGVHYEKTTNKYFAVVSIEGKTKYGKVYSDKEDAYQEYKELKYAEIKRVAAKALEKGDIDNRVFNALLNYKID